MRLLCAAGLALLAFVVDVGCGSTGSKRFVFDARAGGVERPEAAPGEASFVNAGGWNVTLTKANFTIGPVYLNVVSPLSPTSAVRFSLLRSAHAHDEHLGAGRVVGEVLGQITVDALSSDLVSFSTQGTVTQEEVRTAEVWLWPAPGIAAETNKIATVAAEVAGEATRGDARVRFRGALVLDDAWANDAEPGDHSATPISELRRVRGIPARFVPEEGGKLEIRIDPRRLFDGADFASLDGNPADADGTKVLVQSKSGAHTTDQVMKNMFEGLRAARGTYSVRWVMP